MTPTSLCASDTKMGNPSQRDKSHRDSEGFTVVVRKGSCKGSASGGDFDQHGKETGGNYLTNNASQPKSSQINMADESKLKPSLNLSDESIFPSLEKPTKSNETSPKPSATHKTIVPNLKEQIRFDTPDEEVLCKVESTEDMPIEKVTSAGLLVPPPHATETVAVPKTMFLHTLADTVSRKGSSIFATWYDGKGKPDHIYTYEGMWNEAGAIAHILRNELKLNKGDRVVLCYNFGLQFFAAFLGCVRAGVTAVLVYPPSPRSLSKTLPKMTLVANDCDAKFILVDSDISRLRKADTINPLSKSRHLWPKDIKFKNVHPMVKRKCALVSFDDESLTKDDIAFLQYTSGSTGKPKGVMVSYGAVEHNVRLQVGRCSRDYERRGMRQDDIVCFSWLPQYHDMGLISATIAPFTAGWTNHMISPVTFIKNPLLWMELMSKHKVTVSTAPDFAYRLVAKKLMDSKSKGMGPDLDLSSVVRIYSAAEPIRCDTINQFQDAFTKHGLPKDWFGACYGLAENVAAVSSLEKLRLSKYQPSGQSIVAVGHESDFKPFGETIKVVCPTHMHELGTGAVGELWVSCPSKASGYFGQPELSTEVFHATLSDNGDEETYLRTGDLAFIENGYLYICGRHKDLVIVNGVNYYPQDIEYAIQNASPHAVRPGCMAAFSSDDSGGDGNLDVVFEIRQSCCKNAREVVDSVRMAIMQDITLVPTRVVAIEERSIPKTTSGKIQRKATRHALHAGNLKVVYEYEGNCKAATPDKKHSAELRSGCDIEQGLVDPSSNFDDIILKYFGEDLDHSSTWEDLGMSSMTSIQIRDSISERFPINLAPDCFDLYPTPESMKEYVLHSQGTSLPIVSNDPHTICKENLSWSALGYLQFLCSISLLCLHGVAVIPAWFFGTMLVQNASTTVEAYGTGYPIKWTFVPFAVPVWMMALSLIVVALKWLIVGKYEEGICPVQSTKYLRWWYVDRAVSLWEFWVGRYIRDTPLINLFYWMMGANIHRSAAIDAFVREFDLVEIGANTSIDHPINCHRFQPWVEGKSALVCFRKIIIGKDCTVKGMVSLGAEVGDGVHIENLSVVSEGAQVPDKSYITGNPAFCKIDIEPKSGTRHSWLITGVLKVSWITFELYLFFGIMLLGQYLWTTRLPSWRYAPLLGWVLILAWVSLISVVTSIIIKWLLIGKRRAGAYNDNIWRLMADWAADWHYAVSTNLLLSFTYHSRIWNLIAMLHGMDIDYVSQSQIALLPSTMDMIKVRKSFVSRVSFASKGNGEYSKIEIKNSSIGCCVHVDASQKGLEIENVVVAPCATVNSSIMGKESDASILEHSSLAKILFHEAATLLLYLLSFGLFVLTLVPSYDIFNKIVVIESYWSVTLVIPGLAAALILQSMAWVIVIASIQYIALYGSEKRGSPWSKAFFSIYNTAILMYQAWSCRQVFQGSPAFNFLVRLLGGTFEGRAILMPFRLHDVSLLTFADKTIITNASLNGHYVVYNEVSLGPTRVSGVVHDGAFIANAIVSGEGVGPCRAIVANHDSTDTEEPLRANDGLIHYAKAIDKSDNSSINSTACGNVNDIGSDDRSFIAFLEFLKAPSI